MGLLAYITAILARVVRAVDPELDPVSHYNLALEHWAHFQHTWEQGELDKSIFHCRVTVELCPERHPYRDTALNDLGGYLYTRFEQYGRIEDLEEAIEHHRAALELRPDGHPDRSSSLSNLALSLHTRFRRCGRTEDLDEAVGHHRAALEICYDGHPNRSMTLNNLAIALHTRFRLHGQTKDLDEAIDYHRTALELRPYSHPNRSKSLNNLAAALHTRFDLHGRIADLDEAVKYHRAALKHIPEGHPDRSTSLHNLANCLHIRFQQHGQSADLFDAIKYHRAALELRPNSHPNRSSSLYNLADTLQTLFKQHGQAADLDEAIERHRAALELRPNGHPNRSESLNSLAISVTTRFERYGSSVDLDEAIKHHHAALELCPVGHPNRSTCLNNLAGCLATRFERHGQSADLDEAIKHHRAALELRTNDHPNRSSSLNNLAGCLVVRFEQRGWTTDLDEAVERHRTALELRPEGHHYRFSSLNNLATSLHTRFGQYGQSEDLDEAVEHYRAALELCPDGHSNRSVSLNNLASSLAARFQQHGRTPDLDEAIEHHRAALELCPSGHPNRSKALNNLASTLHVRFQQHGQTADLDKAIEHHRAALELFPVSHPDRPTSLDSLADSLHTQFQQHGRVTDLEEAIELHRVTLELCPDGHPNHSRFLASLASSLDSRFKKFGVVDDFNECIQLFECAAVHKFSSSVMRLRIAAQWAELARSHSHHTTSRAYKVAMLLLQRNLTVSPTLRAQHDFLNQKNYYGTLALNAVAYSIEGGRLEEAVEILEQGRGLLWSQMRGFRTPLDHLAKANRALADRFRTISRQLESLLISPTESRRGFSMAGSRPPVLDMHRERRLFEERLKLKKQLSDEQEEVIDEIWQIPGFANFLKATSFTALQQVASEGPVIVVNHCKYRSDVLIVVRREDRPVICVPLDEEFAKDSIELYINLLETRLNFGADSSQYDQVLGRVMGTLWSRVVCKVVDKLNELGIAKGSRIWWCPTFVLSSLPFHAAGPFQDIDGSTKYLLDKYISSYTPTLGALIGARVSCGNADLPTALIIGDTSLPSAKGEIRRIRNCGINTKLLSSKASHDAVVKALQKTAWVHFVCHGGLDSKPFNSSFKVSDRDLTLLDIVRADLPNAEFAFLSACHTAEQPHDSAPDEVLHLAAAIQFSGFRSVIGSMWELLDVDGPFFARVVYQYMCDCDDGEARYKRAAAGLRKAAVELKERHSVRAERWVNLVHIGA